MQVIRATELFQSIRNIDNNEFEKSSKINLDFSNIESIDLKAITMLLNIQKVALLNNKSISISNVSPKVSRILDVTGLNKTFANVATNPIARK
ncbi:TPA: STAS domain-containing protein [Candidatus Avigastranaerophilus faecigallinarum]|nr:STAS domain-containing protein [Candidatus Avigastranaerophilus faecigallinarum]